jgi:hypothetical protein
MSAEFPVTNGGLADAFHAVNNEVIGFAHANNYGGPVTMMEVASLLAVTFGAVANQLVQATAYPATVVPVPANADQATAMELVGYHYLKANAPERLRTDTVVIPRELLLRIVELLSVMQRHPDSTYRDGVVQCLAETEKIIVDSWGKPV